MSVPLSDMECPRFPMIKKIKKNWELDIPGPGVKISLTRISKSVSSREG